MNLSTAVIYQKKLRNDWETIFWAGPQFFLLMKLQLTVADLLIIPGSESLSHTSTATRVIGDVESYKFFTSDFIKDEVLTN